METKTMGADEIIKGEKTERIQKQSCLEMGKRRKKIRKQNKNQPPPLPPLPPLPIPNPWQKHQERNSGENSVMKVEEERDTCLKLLGSQSWKEPQLRQGPGSDQCKILLRECFQNKKRKRRIQYKNARIMKNIGEEQNLPI